MTSDYEAITRHNERQLGLDTSSRKTQICMYSDSTHFIYEILQNADDYGATEVFFKLLKNELLIEHNGDPFQEENVKAITYFGKSTSRDDLVKTGRFGVGFKSVFAFTGTPIIISGAEHFQVHGLYRVKEYPYPSDLSRSRTRIILPFNHETELPDYVDELMSEKKAYSKISARLTKLNMNTLLFTRTIREIRWEIDGRSGHYLREDDSADDVRWTTITDGGHLRKYLVFSRIPKWKGEDYKAVDVAFLVDEKRQLIPVDDFLYVLFATTQETHLQFILNGPYRTNPSRETISEEDHFNVHLMNETCVLMKEILQRLKEMGLLTTQFFAVLPNNTDKLRDFYAPLFETTVKTFHDYELVPTDDNQYASSKNVLQGPSAIREVITKEELPFFLGRKNMSWAKGVQQNSRPDYFLRGLNIQQWGFQELQEILEEKFSSYLYDRNADIKWLEARSDAWLQKLYIMLADAIRREDCSESSLSDCRIIRVISSKDEDHVAGPRAYFPKGRSYKDLPQVKPAILRGKNAQATKKIQESLTSLGVSEIGDAERIDLILENYYGVDAAEGEVDSQMNLQHMTTFIKWWKKEEDADKFERYAIFLTEDGNQLMLRQPSDCYLDAPLHKSGLDVIYKDKNCKLSRKWKIWSGYRKVASDDFINFAVECGVADRLSIEEQECANHPNQSSLMEDWNRRGTKFTYTGTDRDYVIRGLKELLKASKREVSLLIWRTLSEADRDVLEARFRPNQQYEERTDKSSLVIALSKAQWLPDKKGRFHKPCDLSKDTIHPDFKVDKRSNRNGWLDEIGFGESARKASEEYQKRKEMAAFLGVPADIIDGMSKLPNEERDKMWNKIKGYFKKEEDARKRAQRIQQESIPYHKALAQAFSADGRSQSNDNVENSGSSRNASRRRAKTAEEIMAAIENEGKLEARFSFSLRKKWKGKNDQVRLSLAEWYGGKCQICGNTFDQRSGEPYFEGIYLVPYTTAEWLDRSGNVLCLCPWHSAMFQFGAKKMDEDIVEQVMRLRASSEGGSGDPAIHMKLCGEQIQIEFAEKHFIDLQEMIKASQTKKASG